MARYPGRRTPSAPLALGWYVLRFQRFCRFAARETGTFDSARSSMAQLSMGDRLPSKRQTNVKQQKSAWMTLNWKRQKDNNKGERLICREKNPPFLGSTMVICQWQRLFVNGI